MSLEGTEGFFENIIEIIFDGPCIFVYLTDFLIQLLELGPDAGFMLFDQRINEVRFVHRLIIGFLDVQKLVVGELS